MAKVPDASKYDIEKVRKEWIGKSTPKEQGRYPVEYDAIRRHEHMCGGRNPLFLDPQWCKENSPHKAVVAPPVMTSAFAGDGAWPRGGGDGSPAQLLDPPTIGDRAINLNVEWEFLKPVKVGDWLSHNSEIADIYIKPIRLDPKAVWTVMQTNVYNQSGERVAIGRNTLLRHRAPEEVEADPDTARLRAAEKR